MPTGWTGDPGQGKTYGTREGASVPGVGLPVRPVTTPGTGAGTRDGSSVPGVGSPVRPVMIPGTGDARETKSQHTRDDAPVLAGVSPVRPVGTTWDR